MSTGLENWSHASLEQAVLDLQRKAETVDLFHALARDVIARIMTTPNEWVETPMDVRLRLEACIRRAEENAALRKRVEEAEGKIVEMLSDKDGYWSLAKCSNCGVLLNCNGSQREHESVWKARAEKAERELERLQNERS